MSRQRRVTVAPLRLTSPVDGSSYTLPDGVDLWVDDGSLRTDTAIVFLDGARDFEVPTAELLKTTKAHSE